MGDAMTYEFEYLMHLFYCGARGTVPMPPCQAIEFDRLLQFANEQTVLPLIGVALSNAVQNGFPSEKVHMLVSRTRNMELTNYIKIRQIMKLLQDFEKEGIRAVLLKGHTLANLYADPNSRISCDTDIYIDIKDEKRSCKLLKDHGCHLSPRSPTSHHTVCVHPQMGQIELHVILYDEFVEDIWFGRMSDKQFIQEALEKHVAEDGSYFTLGKTDNLIFLALHMIKHFILSGTSLRQMMDIALYMKEYRSCIDFKRFWNTLETMKYRKLMNTVLNAMITACGFSQEDFIGFETQEEKAISALLNDLEAGGWLGYKEEDRKDSWYIYNRIKYTENKTSFSYWCYMIKRNANIYKQSIFPTKPSLERNYPYIKKVALLVPIAWIHRLFLGVWRLMRGKIDTGIVLHNQQVSSKENSREELFKLLNIM
jgi:hypothetical protein